MSSASILADLRPCGYVLATSQYKYFALKCLHCDKNYAQWATFLQHLKQFHDRIIEETQRLGRSNNKIILPPQIENIFAADDRNDHTAVDADAIEHQIEELLYDDDQYNCEETLESQAEDIEPTTREDCVSKCINFNETDVSTSWNVSNGVINYIGNQNEKSLYEDEEDNIDSNDLETRRDLESIDNNEDYIEETESYRDFNTDSQDVSNASEYTKLTIDLSKSDVMTEQFIEIYENFPLLWTTKEIDSKVKNQKWFAKTQMLKSLTAYNPLISMANLEEAVLQIHRQYFDITRRLEEGIEISDIEEKYFTLCYFIKPYNKIQLEHSQIVDETTATVGSLSEVNLFDKDSQTAFDLSDNEVEALQDNLQQQQSLVKLSVRNKVTSEFIRCLRDHSCLWNPQDPAYKDSVERAKATEVLKKYFFDNYGLNTNEGKLNTDIKRLYSFYNRCNSSQRVLNATRKYYYELCKYLADAELHNYQTQRSDKHQIISFSNNDELTLSFIDFCAMHPVLWNKNDPEYSCIERRKEAYDEIALNLKQLYNLEFNNVDLYYAIAKLKRNFDNLQRKRAEQQESSSLTTIEEDFLERCSFLQTSKNSFKCHICQHCARSRTTLQTHLLKKHNIGELPHKCDYCDQRFAQRNHKREHEVRAHTKEFEWFCPDCGKGFASRRDMEMHLMVHKEERKIVCELCGKCFRLRNQLNEHVKIIHERLRRFKCTMCTKDFARKRQLDDHVRAHLNIRDKICNICGKSFTNLHGLFRHKQLHTVKQHECNVCGMRFHRVFLLNSHKKRKHQIDVDSQAKSSKNTA